MSHVEDTCNIGDFMAVSGILSPEVNKIKYYIFISELYQNDIEELEAQFANNRKEIEQFINT